MKTKKLVTVAVGEYGTPFKMVSDKTQHTPGPWHTPGEVFKPMNYGRPRSEYHNPEAYRAIGIGNGASHIGYVSVTGCVPESEAKANACLIASAPDLLRALEIILAQSTPVNTLPWEKQPQINYAQTLDAIAKQARAAIARATGQTQTEGV